MSGHADSCMAVKSTVSLRLEDKHVVNEHHRDVIGKTQDTTQKKNVLTWCVSVQHVTGLKQIRGIKNVTLEPAKNFIGVDMKKT